MLTQDTVMDRDIEREVTSLTQTLTDLPLRLLDVETKLAQTKRTIDELKESLEFAETAAQMSAKIDGKNEQIRKLQTAQVLAQDPEIQRWRSELRRAQTKADEHQAEADKLRRQFLAATHLAELRAAQLRTMAR